MRGKLFIFIAAVILVGTGCNPTKRLQEGEYLVNKLKIDSDHLNVDKERLQAAVKQKPNRRIFTLGRFHLKMYNLPNPKNLEKARAKKDARVRKRNIKRIEKGKRDTIGYKPTMGEWFRNVVGEAPVILDTVSAEESKKQLSLLLTKKGYFDNNVELEIKKTDKWPRKKRAKLIYTLTAEDPYTVDTISRQIADQRIKTLIEKNQGLSLIKSGQQFDVDVLDNERSRITTQLRNEGYYFFVKEYIEFEIDSINKDKKIDVKLIIKNPANLGSIQDTTIKSFHKSYAISDVFFRYKVNAPNQFSRDTMMIRDFHFINSRAFPLDPHLLLKNTFIQKGEKFQQDHVEQTYQRLLAIEVLSLVNIQFVEDPHNPRALMAIIDVSFNKRASFSFETTGTTNSGTSLGLLASTILKHKNIFKAGEVLNLKLAGGVESQNLLTDSNTDQVGADIFQLNTIEFGPELSLKIPRLLWPFNKASGNNTNPSTTISTAYNYQSRPDYKRALTTASLSYRLRENKKSRILFNPVEVNVIKINKSQEFIDLLDEINDSFLSDSYEDHFILVTSASFIKKTQSLSSSRLLFYNRLNVESAGNFLNLVSSTIGLEQNEEGSFKIADIPYAQYLKASNDFRLYRRVNDKSSLASRFAAGIGIPLTNIDVLPFSKSFIGGGANGIRAWKARSLGPGSYFEPNVNFDKIGDIHIEGNVEYRFDLINYLEGAFFLDAGNIWLYNSDSLRVGSQFAISSFASEIAFGAGIGARLDFDYFLVRFDLAMQLKDPSLPGGERWLFEPKDQYNQLIKDYNTTVEDTDQLNPYRARINMNIGIGYPF